MCLLTYKATILPARLIPAADAYLIVGNRDEKSHFLPSASLLAVLSVHNFDSVIPCKRFESSNVRPQRLSEATVLRALLTTLSAVLQATNGNTLT